jgi:acetyl-CoA synthetase
MPPPTACWQSTDRARHFFLHRLLAGGEPSFQGKWYLTGDTMHQDADGYLYFVARNDDIITSAGYRIGPSDVESVIIEHPSVAEVAVVGKPDQERNEIVKAFVVLRDGHSGSPELAEDPACWSVTNSRRTPTRANLNSSMRCRRH